MHPDFRSPGKLAKLWIVWGPFTLILILLHSGYHNIPLRDSALFLFPPMVFELFICLSIWSLCKTHSIDKKSVSSVFYAHLVSAVLLNLLWLVLINVYIEGLNALFNTVEWRDIFMSSVPFLVVAGFFFYFLSCLFHYLILSLEKGKEREMLVMKNKLEKERIARELKLAHEIQAHLLPQSLPVVKNTDLFAKSWPCYEMAGDYFDLIPLDDNRTLMAVADVSGKGAGAALIMSNLHAGLRMAVQLTDSLSDIVFKINNLIYNHTLKSQFITFFIGILESDTGKFSYVNAGHNPAVVISEKDKIKFLKRTGILLGVQKDREYEMKQITLKKGDSLTIYTDGFDEAMDETHTVYGTDRLIDTLKETSGKKASATAHYLFDRVTQFSKNNSIADDLTLIHLKYDICQ